MKCLLLATFLIIGSRLDAQQPMLIRYTIEDGLPSNEVYHILEDSHGYLWFSTDRGVSRFDGHTFENFTTNDGLMNNTVFSCTEDEKGRIWFSSYAPTLSYYENGGIHPFKYNQNIRNLNLPVVAKEELIIDNQTLYSIASLFSVKIEPDGKVIILNDELGFHINPLSRGHFVFTGREGEERYRDGDPKMVKLYNGNTIYETIIRPVRYRILTLDNQSIVSTGTHLFNIKNNTVSCKAIFDQTIDCIALDSRGGLWLTFAEKGVCRYDSSLVSWEAQVHLLDGKSVSHIMEDREGGFWISVLGEGVFYAPNQYGTQYYSEKLPTEKVADMCSAGNNRMFVSFSNGDIWELCNDSVRRVRANPVPLRHGGFNPIHFDRSAGQLISIADLERIFMENKRSIAQQQMVLNKRTYEPDEITPRYFTVIEPDPDGGIWVGSHTELMKFNTDGTIKLDHFPRSPADSIGPHKLNVDALTRDKNGMIWLGTVYGLVQYDKGRWIHKYTEHPLLTSRIDDMAWYNDSTILMAGRGTGIVCFSSDTIYQISSVNGLSNDLVNSVVVDSTGTVWVGTNNGLNKITFKSRFNYSIKQYSTAHGLPSNYISKLHVEGNKIYVGTMSGLCVLLEEDMNPNQVTPVMKITGWEVNGTSYPVTDGRLLAYDQNSVNFDFIGITFNNSENVAYQYRLDGLETDWQTTDNRNVRYNSLPHRPYSFMIKARNADGYWSEPVHLSFVIAPPFWERWWFRALSALVILGLIVIGLQWHYRRLNAKYKIEKQLIQLESKALRAQMNPHFIFNVLSSIQDYVSRGDTVASEVYLVKFSRLIRLILENSRESFILLSRELDMLEYYLEVEQIRFREKFNYTISLDPGLDPTKFYIPPMLIQPYVENAVVHGLRSLEESGQVTLAFSLGKNGNLRCEITDNGIGWHHEAQPTRNYQPLGMLITRERLQLLNRSFSGQLEVVIQNLGSIGLPGSGTKVIITVPVNRHSKQHEDIDH